MTSRLNPYIGFGGDARRAMEFYQQVFGGDLTLKRYGDFPGAASGNADKIMHGLLETPRGFTIMGADTEPGTTHRPCESISLILSGDDVDDLRGYWERLSAAGTVTTPLEKQMWGDEFGACQDQFGVNWMVNISQP